MATTTLLTAVAAFKTLLDSCIAVDPGDSLTPIRRATWAQGVPTDGMKPFITAQPLMAKRIASEDGNTLWKLMIKLRIVFDPMAANKAIEHAIRYHTVFDNKMDAWLPQSGLEGGEDIEWAYTIPEDPGHGRTAFIEASLDLVCATVRGTN